MTWLARAGVLLALGGCEPRHGAGQPSAGERGGPGGGGAELTVVGEDARLRRDEPLPATSPLFDGARVRLRGGRGETLALQVMTRNHDAPVTLAWTTQASATAPASVTTRASATDPPKAARPRRSSPSASATPPTSASPAPPTSATAASTAQPTSGTAASPAPPASATAASPAPPASGTAASATQPMSATAASPAPPTSATAASATTTPSPSLRIDAFAVHWLDVREPSTTMYGPSRGAGRYPDPLQPSAQPVRGDALFDVVIAADAVVGLHRGTLTVAARTFPVELTVEPVQIALQDDPLVWIWYMPGEIARAHGLPDDDRALLPLERRYHALARAHGAYLASDLSVERFLARQSLMQGTRFWPVQLDLSTDASAQQDVREWLSQFAPRPQTAFTIPIDEPHSAEERAATRAAGERIGRHDKLLRAVTAPPSPDFAAAMDVFIGPASRPPHRWTYNGTPPAAGSLVIDAAGPSLRTWGWIAQRYGVELWYAWEGTYFADRYNGGGPTDVLTDPLTFDQRRKRLRSPDWGNGDGVLLYPGRGLASLPGATTGGASRDDRATPTASDGQTLGATSEPASHRDPGADEPWPSLRLKALRRGLQDRLLLRALERCGAGDAAAAATRALIPRALDEGSGAAAWPDDPAAWEAARGQLYDIWRARCGQSHG